MRQRKPQSRLRKGCPGRDRALAKAGHGRSLASWGPASASGREEARSKKRQLAASQEGRQTEAPYT